VSNDILDQHPALVECRGGELASVIDEVRRRGGIVETMTVACVSQYRLSIYWPPAEQPALIETENGA
jgi:hypothetical protein